MPSDHEAYELYLKDRKDFDLLAFAAGLRTVPGIDDNTFSEKTESAIGQAAALLDRYAEILKHHAPEEDKPLGETIVKYFRKDYPVDKAPDMRAMYLGEWAGYGFFLTRQGHWILMVWQKHFQNLEEYEFHVDGGSGFIVSSLVYGNMVYDVKHKPQAGHIQTSPLHAVYAVISCAERHMTGVLHHRKERISRWEQSLRLIEYAQHVARRDDSAKK